jgi:hypothetical protein
MTYQSLYSRPQVTTYTYYLAARSSLNLSWILHNLWFPILGCTIVHSSMRDQVLKEVHSQGHFGRDKTLSLLQQMYFWDGMDKDVTKLVQSCLTNHDPKSFIFR